MSKQSALEGLTQIIHGQLHDVAQGDIYDSDYHRGYSDALRWVLSWIEF